MTKAEAASLGLSQYDGRPCPKGHTGRRYVRSRSCVACQRVYTSNWKIAHPDIAALHNAKYNIRTYSPEKRRATYRRKWQLTKASISQHISSSLRTRLGIAIRESAKSGSAVRDLGCSIPEFRYYIAALFQPDMSWENWGEWHLDHIRPLAAFDLTDRGQFLQACHYTNYQPLWATANIAKKDKIMAEIADHTGKI